VVLEGVQQLGAEVRDNALGLQIVSSKRHKHLRRSESQLISFLLSTLSFPSQTGGFTEFTAKHDPIPTLPAAKLYNSHISPQGRYLVKERDYTVQIRDGFPAFERRIRRLGYKRVYNGKYAKVYKAPGGWKLEWYIDGMTSKVGLVYDAECSVSHTIRAPH